MAISAVRPAAGQDDALALPRIIPPQLEHGARSRQGLAHRFEGRRPSRSAGDGAYEQLLERSCTREQDLALIGEVPEERAFRQARPLGDFRHARVVESPLAVERHGRVLQPVTAVRLPTSHR